MLELWDAYDNQFNKLDNIVLVRGDEIPDGIYHLVCEIAVRHTDGQYLLMQRDKRKHFGGMWELTAGGSALKGELPLECAVRELREETGICSENLIEIGRVVLCVIFAVCDEVEGVVIGDPYIVCLQIIIQTLYVWYVFIGQSLLPVSHQRNYCFG